MSASTARNAGVGHLIIGLGELGTAMVKAFLNHPNYDHKTHPISVMIRPATISSPSTEKGEQLSWLQSQGVNVIGGDVESSSLEELTTLFSPYHTIIHAGGMTISPGTQLKVTQAVLATRTNKLYLPWQFGVDYDVITRQGGQGMFSEQLDVRDLLRGQSDVQWVIVSCGIFMSFLFEEFWGAVVRDSQGAITKVRALGSWDDLLTATDAVDIGACTADLVLRDVHLRNKSVYIAGDSVKYAEFAEIVDQVIGKNVEKELWTTEFLEKESKQEPENKLKKYRVVFSEGMGLAWPKEGTYNQDMKSSMTSIRQYLESHER